tara:strand:+ start:785 stop:1054 length:270 start_codon:yes stop_codon:yes gene_type:complete
MKNLKEKIKNQWCEVSEISSDHEWIDRDEKPINLKVHPNNSVMFHDLDYEESALLFKYFKTNKIKHHTYELNWGAEFYIVEDQRINKLL